MINFNVDALRAATDEARTTRINAANDLVQRTLAQHGLMPDLNSSGKDGPPSGAILRGVLSRFQSPLDPTGPKHVALPDGATFETAQLSCAAGSRAYRTYVPSTASEGVTGLVVMLHGCTQTPEDFALGTGMNALAEQHRFVVLYPQQSRGDNAQSCWNWFSRGDQRRDRGEPAILTGMTRKAAAEHGVSRDQTFVAGLSAGAAMAVILGETYPDVFAAVGAHSGLPFGAAKDVPSAFAAMSGNGQSIATPDQRASVLPTIIFHGTADTTVVPANGASIARAVLDRGPDQTVESDEHGQMTGRRFTRKIVTGPNDTALLEHWVIEGMGHAWSGGQPQGSYTDTKGPDASAEMIRFFYATSGKNQ